MTFLLPCYGGHPIGGLKVAYEYANVLATRGHHVTVVHPSVMWERCSAMNPREIFCQGGRAVFCGLARYALYGIFDLWDPNAWFRVNPRVKMMWIPTLMPSLVPDSDALIATGWLTAERLATWSNKKGSKFYLIQSLENWSGPADRVLATWQLPLQKIVIAKWLLRIAEDLGEAVCYIPNGLDFQQFSCEISPELRDPVCVSMLYHTNDIKGSHDGLEALKEVKHRVPELHVQMFGVPKPPKNLANWIHYQHNPPQSKLRAIYNHASIFVAPSWLEGWALPPAEAMACGCALAATDIGGHQEYMQHQANALLSPPRNPEQLANNIVRLIKDNELRVRLALNGMHFIGQFTWQRAADLFEEFLRSGLGE